MKVEIITLVIQFSLKSVVVTNDECQVQVICLIIPSTSLFNIWFRWVNVFDMVYELFVVENNQVIYIPVKEGST